MKVRKVLGVVVACGLFCQLSFGGSVVKLEKTGTGYHLTRNGQPYFIKGAGGRDRLDELVACGGNSIRTWGADDIGPLLDKAQSLGLTVTVGIWLGHKSHGFNYSDANAVAEQLERAKRNIRQYKDHPALLMWALGNEMEDGDAANPKLWGAINEMAKEVKAMDPNHPTMTVVAEVWPEKIKAFNEFAPLIDIMGINTYGGVQSIRKRYNDAGGARPYMVTEFGPPGQWEIPKNAWGAPHEMNSTEKAKWYLNGYRDGILSQKDLCLGSYVFIWGFKQEATATWYGLFLKDGARLATVESMTEVWGGKPPKNRCPVVTDIKLDKDRGLKPGDVIHASWTATDPDSDPLTVKWILRRESGQYETGGEDQADQPEFPDTVVKATDQGAEIKIPESGGPYRLFGYAYDGKGNAAVANVPLKVEGRILAPKLVAVKVPFKVYGDGADKQPYIPSGYMGNTHAIAMDAGCKKQPFSGTSCIEVAYKAADGWGGVVWQSPPNDWGNAAGGFDLSSANVLSFRARGAEGGEKVAFGVGMIGKDKPFPDSDKAELKGVELTADWKEYRIPLGGKNLACIKSGFYWTLGGQGKPVVFYLDEIAYVNDPSLPTAVSKPVAGAAVKEKAAPVSRAPARTETKAAANKGGAATPGAVVLAVYKENGDPMPFIPSGYMGNHAAIKMDGKCASDPHAGATCIKAEYTADGEWGGVVWQSPANDWGNQPGGHDVSGATDLSFWAKGEEGGEKLSFGVGMIGADKPYPDSDKASLKDVVLTREWQEYRIPLTGKNLSSIKSGFYWTLGGQGKPVVFCLDDIAFVSSSATPVAAPVAKASAGGKKAGVLRLALPLAVYEEDGDTTPYIPSGYMGNTGAIKMDGKCASQPHAGSTCLKVDYSADGEWGGVAWQSPANDWGSQPGGYDLTGASSLAFWARGEAGGEKVSFGVGMIGSDKPYFDTGKGTLKDVELTTTWQEFKIPLEGQDLSRIKSGFFWTLGGQGKPLTFYLDDVRFVGKE